MQPGEKQLKAEAGAASRERKSFFPSTTPPDNTECMICRWLEHAMDQTGSAWFVTRVDLMMAATELNGSEYNRLRGIEMAARLDADVARVELEKHRLVHARPN